VSRWLDLLAIARGNDVDIVVVDPNLLGDGSYRAAARALAGSNRQEGGPRRAAAAIHALTD
jgi:hypothetical protein